MGNTFDNGLGAAGQEDTQRGMFLEKYVKSFKNQEKSWIFDIFEIISISSRFRNIIVKQWLQWGEEERGGCQNHKISINIDPNEAPKTFSSRNIK